MCVKSSEGLSQERRDPPNPVPILQGPSLGPCSSQAPYLARENPICITASMPTSTLTTLKSPFPAQASFPISGSRHSIPSRHLHADEMFLRYFKLH